MARFTPGGTGHDRPLDSTVGCGPLVVRVVQLAGVTAVEIAESHEAQVGALHRPTGAARAAGAAPSGAWCFADHMGPADVTEGSGLDVGPASAHGPADGHLAARRPGAAQGQPRLRAADLARAAQPDDRRPRGGACRGGDGPLPGHPRGHPAVDRAAGRDPPRRGRLRAPRRAAPGRTARRRRDRARRELGGAREPGTARHAPRRRRPRRPWPRRPSRSAPSSSTP